MIYLILPCSWFFQMKYIALTFLAVAVALCAARPDEARYTTKYDSIDLDQILKSDRLFKNYFNCLMDKGKCTPDGSELKRVLPDALKTDCSKCSERQRDGTDRVIRYLSENKPSEWKALQDKYDPEHIFINKFRSEAESRGIKVE